MSNLSTTTVVKSGDLLAMANKQGQLHALLGLICHDDFSSFNKLSGKRQFDLLRLARSVSDDLNEVSAPVLAKRATKVEKHSTARTLGASHE